jgi:hypothetical protein
MTATLTRLFRGSPDVRAPVTSAADSFLPWSRTDSFLLGDLGHNSSTRQEHPCRGDFTTTLVDDTPTTAATAHFGHVWPLKRQATLVGVLRGVERYLDLCGHRRLVDNRARPHVGAAWTSENPMRLRCWIRRVLVQVTSSMTVSSKALDDQTADCHVRRACVLLSSCAATCLP